jgi:hypothetical protein
MERVEEKGREMRGKILALNLFVYIHAPLSP